MRIVEREPSLAEEKLTPLEHTTTRGIETIIDLLYNQTETELTGHPGRTNLLGLLRQSIGADSQTPLLPLSLRILTASLVHRTDFRLKQIMVVALDRYFRTKESPKSPGKLLPASSAKHNDQSAADLESIDFLVALFTEHNLSLSAEELLKTYACLLISDVFPTHSEFGSPTNFYYELEKAGNPLDQIVIQKLGGDAWLQPDSRTGFGYIPLVFIEMLSYRDCSKPIEEWAARTEGKRYEDLWQPWAEQILAQLLAQRINYSLSDHISTTELYDLLLALMNHGVSPTASQTPFSADEFRREKICQFFHVQRSSDFLLSSVLRDAMRIALSISHTYQKANASGYFYNDRFKNEIAAFIDTTKFFLGLLEQDSQNFLNRKNTQYFEQDHMSMLRKELIKPRINYVFYDPDADCVLVMRSQAGLYLLPTEGYPGSATPTQAWSTGVKKWVGEGVAPAHIVFVGQTSRLFDNDEYQTQEFAAVLAETPGRVALSQGNAIVPPGKERVTGARWIPRSALPLLFEAVPQQISLATQYFPEVTAARVSRYRELLQRFCDTSGPHVQWSLRTNPYHEKCSFSRRRDALSIGDPIPADELWITAQVWLLEDDESLDYEPRLLFEVAKDGMISFPTVSRAPSQIDFTAVNEKVVQVLNTMGVSKNDQPQATLRSLGILSKRRKTPRMLAQAKISFIHAVVSSSAPHDLLEAVVGKSTAEYNKTHQENLIGLTFSEALAILRAYKTNLAEQIFATGSDQPDKREQLEIMELTLSTVFTAFYQEGL